MSRILWLIVPAYNEENVIHNTANLLKNLLKDLIALNKISNGSKILFIDDGSQDKTWSIIEKLNKQDDNIKGLKFIRNYGHENALLAGLTLAKDNNVDFTISLDIDLQDDISVIEEFINKYIEGYDVVYGVRKSRKNDSFCKKFFAENFYKIMKLIGCPIISNHADYRLLSSKVLDSLSKYPEVIYFLRGFIASLGFNSAIVLYDRQSRSKGISKYSFKALLELAYNAIFSLSSYPISFILLTGINILGTSVIILLYYVIKCFVGHIVSPYMFLFLTILFFSGLQILFLGIIGEYVAKNYTESKKRPRYLVDKII